MKTIIYLLQVSACTGIFYSFYYLVLRRYTFFTLNRWYLLATLLLSFVIPTLNIPIDTAAPSPIMQPVVFVQQMQIVQQPVELIVLKQPLTDGQPFNWMALAKDVYIAFAVLSTMHLLVTLGLFFRRMSNKKLMQIGNVRVLKGSKKLGNSSFLNVIFINDDDLEPEEIKQIITHEMLHVKLMHSADRLIARIIQVGLWFNPFAYCYMRSIEENHEFEVDRIAAGKDNKSMYATLLFKLAVSGQSYLFHGFSKVPLKTRIAMLFNKPTSNMKKIIYLLILPMVVVSCLAFANLKTNEKLSIVHDLSRLGPHPLVLIDGKEYPDDMLYKIGSKCVLTTSVYNPPVVKAAYKKYGDKVKDGLVMFYTKNQTITYQTAIEKENLSKTAAVSKSQFFTRLRLKKEDGSQYDDGLVNMPNGGTMSSEFKVNDKVVFLIAGKAYPESRIKEVEALVKKYQPKSYSVGSVKSNPHVIDADYSDYDTFYHFDIDTVKYRQKRRGTPEQLKAEDQIKQEHIEYRKTDDYKQKQATLNEVIGKTITCKVGNYRVLDKQNFVKGGFIITSDGKEFLLTSWYGQTKILNSLLKTGDEIELKVYMGAFGKNVPVEIEPAFIKKDGKEIYRSKEQSEIPKYAFLYEANRVRFTDGQVTNIQKYANGKWKSAVVEVVNGYKIKFNIKPNAPDFKDIVWGDHVTFRFVHEVKTGAKEYKVNDWVSMTTNIKDYGIKNPDFFYKFYEKS